MKKEKEIKKDITHFELRIWDLLNDLPGALNLNNNIMRLYNRNTYTGFIIE